MSSSGDCEGAVAVGAVAVASIALACVARHGVAAAADSNHNSNIVA